MKKSNKLAILIHSKPSPPITGESSRGRGAAKLEKRLWLKAR